MNLRCYIRRYGGIAVVVVATLRVILWNAGGAKLDEVEILRAIRWDVAHAAIDEVRTLRATRRDVANATIDEYVTIKSGVYTAARKLPRQSALDIRSLPMIPRNNHCRVAFSDPKRSICYFSNNLWDTVSLAVSIRLLEHSFECSASSLPKLDLSKTRGRHDADCLFLRPYKDHEHDDVAWSHNSSHYLLPFLYHDYYAMPTRKDKHPMTYCVIGDDILQQLNVSDLDIHTQSWQELYEKARFCDYIASNEEEGLVLADSMQISSASLLVNISNHSMIEKPGDVTNARLYGRRRTAFEPVLGRLDYDTAQAIADSFPLNLFTSEKEPPALVETPKTLVVVIGNLRGGEVAWQSLYKNVLDVNGADLALLIGISTNTLSSMYTRAKYVWQFPEYTDWADAIDTVNGSHWRTDLPVARPGGTFGGIEGHPGSGAIILMARYWLLQKIKELNLTSVYQRFVVTRADFVYKCRHDLSELDSAFVWVPYGEDYGGISDRHVVAPSELIIKVLNILEPLVTRPERYFFKKLGGNPENAIRTHWTSESIFPHQVRRFPRPMYVGYVADDMTRWGLTGQKQGTTDEGVFGKYMGEYNFAKCFCEGGSVVDVKANSTDWNYTDTYQHFRCS